MDDLISRQEALDALDMFRVKNIDGEGMILASGLAAAMDIIEKLPDAQIDTSNLSPCDVCMYGGDMYEPECLRCLAK